MMLPQTLYILAKLTHSFTCLQTQTLHGVCNPRYQKPLRTRKVMHLSPSKAPLSVTLGIHCQGLLAPLEFKLTPYSRDTQRGN